MKQNITDFLDAHRLTPSAIETDRVLDDFISEMEKGLRGEKSSLQMIPTFITTDTEISQEEPVMVRDATRVTKSITAARFFQRGDPLFAPKLSRIFAYLGKICGVFLVNISLNLALTSLHRFFFAEFGALWTEFGTEIHLN